MMLTNDFAETYQQISFFNKNMLLMNVQSHTYNRVWDCIFL